MPGKIYLLQDNGDLHPLTEHAYENEDMLQGLIRRYPKLPARPSPLALAPPRHFVEGTIQPSCPLPAAQRSRPAEMAARAHFPPCGPTKQKTPR
jgi:hypothetical protein